MGFLELLDCKADGLASKNADAHLRGFDIDTVRLSQSMQVAARRNMCNAIL